MMEASLKKDFGKIHLLIVCTTLSHGGAERDASNFANLLDRQLFDVDIALMRVIIDYPVRDDVTIHDLGKQSMLDNLKAIWRLRKLASSNQYNLVLSSLTTTNFLTFLTTLTLRKFPFWIARLDSDPSQLYTQESRFIRNMIKRLLQFFVLHHADALLTNSYGSKEGALQIVPQCKERLTVIYNPVNLESITRRSTEPSRLDRQRPNSITLITAARLESSKGIAMVLEVIAELIQSGLDLYYIVCGTGPQYKHLNSLSNKLGISDRVTFAGFVKNPYAEMSKADIYVLASVKEGLPNALIESQVLGLPAVATDCRSGPSEVIKHGHTGLLVPVNDQTAMAAAISKLANSQELREQYGKAATHRARAMFDQKKLMVEIQNFLVSSRSSR